METVEIVYDKGSFTENWQAFCADARNRPADAPWTKYLFLWGSTRVDDTRIIATSLPGDPFRGEGCRFGTLFLQRIFAEASEQAAEPCPDHWVHEGRCRHCGGAS